MLSAKARQIRAVFAGDASYGASAVEALAYKRR
jgi:hypothetical protein